MTDAYQATDSHSRPVVFRKPDDDERLAQIVACTHPKLNKYLPLLQAAE